MIQQSSVEEEEFIGLFGIATDKYTIISENFPKIDNFFNTPVLRTKLYDTNLVGVFCAGNSNGLLISNFAKEKEVEKIKKFGDETGFNVETVKGYFNAIGNLIACNNKGAVLSKKILDSKTVEEILDVECITKTIGGHNEVGSCTIVTNKGFIVHPDAEKELLDLKEIFKVDGKIGSVNMGVPYMRSGIIANSFCAIVGEKTTHIEIERISDALSIDY